jgi:hypothetical protein
VSRKYAISAILMRYETEYITNSWRKSNVKQPPALSRRLSGRPIPDLAACRRLMIENRDVPGLLAAIQTPLIMHP